MPGDDHQGSSDSEDHFSDAQSGLEASGAASPLVPSTRIEKVSVESSYGEVPGTNAFNMRKGDAKPDEVVVLPEQQRDGDESENLNPGGHPIPTTIIDKVDPSSPSHGEVPGTIAYTKHAADAVPDLVIRSGERSPLTSTKPTTTSLPGDLPIPTTKVEKVDSEPKHGEVPGTEAFELRKQDAEPDIVEEVGDTPRLPTSHGVRSPINNHRRRRSSGAGRKASSYEDDNNEDEDEAGEDIAFGDDFDDFEEGEDDAEFGDFDDGFQQAQSIPPLLSQPAASNAPLPVLNFAELDTQEKLHTATEPYLNILFPSDTVDTSVLPPTLPENPIFLTPRSASLWLQLAEPPPLQPPDWIRSRIRRLFLVSLGVPVDLDEILPASKQKKLILPSLHLNVPPLGSPRNSTESRISRLKDNERNASSSSLDSQGKPSRTESRKRRGQPPIPQFDLVSARQLCTITDEALNGLTIEELRCHVKKLETMKEPAEEVLIYWTTRTEEKLGDREAFEGVIENLVKHARKTRK